jgi:hypothetical protein
MIRAVSRRWIMALAVLALAGCGSEPRLSASTAGELHKDVEAARTAAQQGDEQAAVAALAALEKHIGQAESDGQLSGAAADALRRGAARARRRAAKEIAAPQPTPEATATPTPIPTATPTPTPTPTSTPNEKPGKGPGKGKGKKEKGGEG